MKVIFDMDPGIDDAMALLLALSSPKLEVLAVTSVAGNVSVDKTTKNALRLIDAMGKNVPVHVGASFPLNGQKGIEAESIHGMDGLGDTDLAGPRSKASSVSALDATIQLLQRHKRRDIDSRDRSSHKCRDTYQEGATADQKN